MNREHAKTGQASRIQKTGSYQRREQNGRERQNIREWRNRGFWLATVLLIMVSVLSSTGTVMSRTDFDAAEMEQILKLIHTRLQASEE